MKKGIVRPGLLGALLVIVLSFITFPAAAEDRPGVSAGTAFLSKYVWRGFELSNDSLVVQPSIAVSYKGFSLGLWGNLDTSYDDKDPATDNTSNWTETDLTLGYEKSFGSVTVGAGYIYYGLDGAFDSQEIYLSASLGIPLSPKLTVYREVSHLPSWYISLGLGHSFELPKGMTLSVAGSVGYYISDDDDFVEVDDNLNPTTEKYRAFHDGLVSVSLSVPLAQYFTVTPMIAYSFPLSDKADNLLTSTSISHDSSFLYGGVTLSMAF